MPFSKSLVVPALRVSDIEGHVKYTMGRIIHHDCFEVPRGLGQWGSQRLQGLWLDD